MLGLCPSIYAVIRNMVQMGRKEIKENIEMDLTITVVEFLLFTIFVAVLSWYKTRDERLDTEEGYFVAGHSLPGMSSQAR